MSNNFPYCLFLTIARNFWALPVFPTQSLPDNTSIAPRLNPASVYPPFFYNLEWIEIQTGLPLSVLVNIYCWTSSFALEASNLKHPSKISFTDIVPYSVNETSKILVTEDPSGWPCSPNPPNVLLPLRIPERHNFPHTNSQRQNGPNYHFRLGLLYAAYPSYSRYENPPQVVQSSQKTLTMEVHQPFHFIFHQIISRRIWKNINKEVHLRHLPHFLLQYFLLSCPCITREYYQSLHH